MTLNEARKRFLDHCSSAFNLSPHTLRAYGGDLGYAAEFFGAKKRVGSLERDHLRQYLYHMRETVGLKETTIKRRLASMKLLLGWATHEAVVEVNPFDLLRERQRRRGGQTRRRSKTVSDPAPEAR